MKRPRTRKLSGLLLENEPPLNYQSWQEYRAEEVLLRDTTAKVLQTLNWEYRTIIEASFGLLDRPPLSLAEIGLIFGWSAHYTRAKYLTALRLLSHPVRCRALFPFVLALSGHEPWEEDMVWLRPQECATTGAGCSQMSQAAAKDETDFSPSIRVAAIKAVQRAGPVARQGLPDEAHTGRDRGEGMGDLGKGQASFDVTWSPSAVEARESEVKP